MWTFNLLAATRTVEATMPFMLYRLAICLGVALASLLATLVGAGTLIAFASFSANPGSMANFGAALGLGGLAFLFYRHRASLFFNIKAGHLALLAELAKGEKLPQGKLQIDLARQKSSQRYPTSTSFMEASEAARQGLKALTLSRCPSLIRLSNPRMAAVLGNLAGRMAQTGSQPLLALSFMDQEGNIWKSVCTGLVLYLRHFDSLSKNRLYLIAFECLGLFAAYLAMLYPVDSAVSLLPVDVGFWRYVFALIFAWSLKTAFFDPITTAALAEVYFNLSKEEVEASEEEMRELETCSEAFGKIREKAASIDNEKSKKGNGAGQN